MIVTTDPPISTSIAEAVPLHCLGVSYRTAPVAMLEQLRFADATLHEALRHVRAGASLDARLAIDRIVILSTCNRIELYTTLPLDDADLARDALLHVLLDGRDMARDAVMPYVYTRHGLDAVTHLFRVTAGLESLALGEPQILAQVAGALRAATARHTVTPFLKRVFKTAVRAGERARTDAWAASGTRSVSATAVHCLCQMTGQFTDQLTHAHVLVIGAGTMGQLAVKALRTQRVGAMTVVNRTLARAERVANRYGARAASLASLPDVARDADAMIVATGSSETVLGTDMMAKVMAVRSHRPLAIVDVSVPRNVSPAVGGLEGVRLLNLDQLSATAAVEMAADREGVVPRVEHVLRAEIQTFLHQRMHSEPCMPCVRL